MQHKHFIHNWRRFLNESKGFEQDSIKKLSNNSDIAQKAVFNSILAQDAFRGDVLSEAVNAPQVSVEFEVSNGSSPDIEIVQKFVKSLYSGKRSGFLSYYDEKEFEKMNLYLVKDKSAGFAIKQDGDIVSVHNNSDLKNMATLFLETAKKKGGTKLDHFDGFLSGLYRRHGFTDVYEVYQWDEQYKPETWSFDPVNIFNPNTSIYAEAYEKKENIPFQDISNLDKSVEMLAEDNFPVSIVPPNKINQYKYGRPDVICRKL
jgi:hypothetical protein